MSWTVYIYVAVVPQWRIVMGAAVAHIHTLEQCRTVTIHCSE